MNPTVATTISALAIFSVLALTVLWFPHKRRRDWRHLSEADRLEIYERARFEALGDRDLEPNVRREAAGRAARDYILARCFRSRVVFTYRNPAWR